MPLLELTRDEQYIRSYFLATDFTRFKALTAESPYLLPVLFLAGFALIQEAHDVMWIAFLYLLGLYVWRFGNGRWSRATRSLIEKYESRIAELDGSHAC